MVTLSISWRRRVCLALLLGIPLLGYLGWVWRQAPAWLTVSRPAWLSRYDDLRQIDADGAVVMTYGQPRAPQRYPCRVDWTGRERWRVMPVPDATLFQHAAWSPDGRTLAWFFAGRTTATVITWRDKTEVARATFPLSLLHPPAKIYNAEPFDVAVDNAGRVMIVCPNAPAVSLVAVQGQAVVATGRFTSALPVPMPLYEDFLATLASDGTALVDLNTNAGSAAYEYRQITVAGRRITTRITRTGPHNAGFAAAGTGDGVLEIEYSNAKGTTLRSVLANRRRVHFPYAGMRKLSHRRMAGGWVALQQRPGTPVLIHQVMSGDTWRFRPDAPVREVLLTPDGRYALAVENMPVSTRDRLMTKAHSLFPKLKIAYQRPDMRLSIYERPGRLRARGYSEYNEYPVPAVRWNYGYGYHFSTDGKTVIEQCEKHGATVFTW